jgi:MFS superfamily sulfate permease-like transporter
VAALAVVFGLRLVAPRIPGALVLVVGGLLAATLFNLGDHGVALVGDVPRGLPQFTVPPLELAWNHKGIVGMAAVALVLVGFSQTAGDARAFAGRHGYRVDIDQESTAQGVANVGAGLFQGMPVSTSLSASSLNDHSGAKSGLASLTSGVMVLLTLLVLAPLFSQLPKAVLGAIIIEAVVFGMMDVPEMRRLARVQRFDFWIAVAAIVGTLLFGVLAGVMIGIALSLIWLVKVATQPPMPLLGREPDTQVFRDLTENPDDEQYPGLVVLRMDGGLFFATSDALEDRVRVLVETTPDLTGVILDCEGINFTDSQGSAKLRDLADLTEQAGATLRLARLKPSAREVLARDGVLDRIGPQRIHGNVHRAVEAQLAENQGR